MGVRKPFDNGSRFGRLTTVTCLGQINSRQHYECVCDCGGRAVVDRTNLRRGITQSCGCLQRERASAARTLHGLSTTPEYTSFKGAQRRCNDTTTQYFKDYGGRGIKFNFRSIDEWMAELGPKPSPQHSVDRIDNNGNYEPGNVRWATRSEQLQNRRVRKDTLAKLARASV